MKKLWIVLCLILLSSNAYALGAGMAGACGVGGVCAATFGAELYTEASAPNPTSDSDSVGDWTIYAPNVTLTSDEATPDTGSTSYLNWTVTGADKTLGVRVYDIGTFSNGNLYRYRFRISMIAAGAQSYAKCGISSERNNGDVTRYITTPTETGGYLTYSIYSTYDGSLDSFVCIEQGTDNAVQLSLDNFSAKVVTDLCYSAELNVAENAVNPTSDSDATTGWAAVGTPAVLDSVATGTPHGGTYHLLITPDAGNEGAYMDLNTILTVGRKYYLSAWVKTSTAGGSVRLLPDVTWASPTTADFFVHPAIGGMVAYTHIGTVFTHHANSRYLHVNAYSATSGDLYFDDLSIKEVTAE